jgi:pyruvate formate lyase activating enzyme
MIHYLAGLNGIMNVDLLPYHQYARNKYRKFNHENRLNGITKPSESKLRKLKKDFEAAGFNVKIGG